MKDVVNPALFILSLVLLVCGVALEDEDVAASVDLWALGICATAFVVDFALGMACAFTHRPALGKVVWGMVFVVVGSSAYLLTRGTEDAEDPALREFYSMQEAYLSTGNPDLTNEVGDTLLVVAASVGKNKTVQEMLGKSPAPEMVGRALLRAAEGGHMSTVKLLLPKVGVNDLCEGTTPLIAAASFGRHKVVDFLLENGADPNLKDESGTPPLVHAVISKSARTVETLLKHGADPKATDASGRDAASFSDSERIDALFGY